MRLKPWDALAREIAGLATHFPGTEQVSLHGGSGRVLAAPLVAALPLPGKTHAVMDGFALGAPPPGRYRLMLSPVERLAADEALAVSSGQPVPARTASVVLSDRALVKEGEIVVREAQAKDNIRRRGEEAEPGAILVRAGTRLDARHLALAAAAGLRSVVARRRPRLALLAISDAETALPHHSIFTAILGSPSFSVTDIGSVRSASLESILLRAAAGHDGIVIVADSLGGEEGLLAKALAGIGGEAVVLRGALKPAKPIVTGRIGAVPVLGLAGTAYATTVAAHLFLRPWLGSLAGVAADDPFLPAIAAFSRPREGDRAEALPVRMRREGQQLMLEPAGRFGQLSALAFMDGFAIVEAGAPGISLGAALLYHPLLMPLI
jgi:molybdopterin molybdotransferase